MEGRGGGGGTKNSKRGRGGFLDRILNHSLCGLLGKGKRGREKKKGGDDGGWGTRLAFANSLFPTPIAPSGGGGKRKKGEKRKRGGERRMLGR